MPTVVHIAVSRASQPASLPASLIIHVIHNGMLEVTFDAQVDMRPAAALLLCQNGANAMYTLTSLRKLGRRGIKLARPGEKSLPDSI